MQNHDDLEIPEFLRRGAAAQAAVDAVIAEVTVTPTAKATTEIAKRDGNPNWKELGALRVELDNVLRGPLPVSKRRKEANRIRKAIKKLAGTPEVETVEEASHVKQAKKTKFKSSSSTHKLSISDLKLKPEAKKALAERAAAAKKQHAYKKPTDEKKTPAEGTNNEKLLTVITRDEGATMAECCKALKLDVKKQRARERVRAIVYHLKKRMGFKISHDGDRYRRGS